MIDADKLADAITVIVLPLKGKPLRWSRGFDQFANGIPREQPTPAFIHF